MFDPSGAAACASCSLLGDSIPKQLEHLNYHNTSFICVSRAPVEKLAAYKKRMGWSFRWVSSYETSFNYDFHATIDEEVVEPMVNFRTKDEYEKAKGTKFDVKGEMPGYSCFIQGGEGIGEKGKIYHTYSTYARGGELQISFLMFLDMTFLGRQDDRYQINGLGFKRHDEYTEEDLKHV